MTASRVCARKELICQSPQDIWSGIMDQNILWQPYTAFPLVILDIHDSESLNISPSGVM